MSLGSTTSKVELTFWRDKARSDAAFWGRVDGDKGVVYPISDAEGHPRAPQQSTWTVVLEDRAISATSVGDRDEWSDVRSNGTGYVAKYGSETLELDGHDVSAVFTYLDVLPLLAGVGLPTRRRVDGRTAEASYGDPDVITTLTRALALVDGGDRLDITYDPSTGVVDSVRRFASGQICESVVVIVDRESGSV